MHFYNLIRELGNNSKIDLFIDMDGVIASYDIGKPYDFLHKRPIKTNIDTLRKISELDNVNLFILSVCRETKQINEKNEWLDINASFFKKENRFILSKDIIKDLTSSEMKLKFLKEFSSNNKVILVDDDNRVLSLLKKELDIILFQDSELID